MTPGDDRPGTKPEPASSGWNADDEFTEDLSWSEDEIADQMALVVTHIGQLIDGALRLPASRLRERLLVDLIEIARPLLPGSDEPGPAMRFVRPHPGWPSGFGLLVCQDCGAEEPGPVLGEDCWRCADRKGRR